MPTTFLLHRNIIKLYNAIYTLQKFLHSKNIAMIFCKVKPSLEKIVMYQISMKEMEQLNYVVGINAWKVKVIENGKKINSFGFKMEKKNIKEELGRMGSEIPRKPLFDGVWGGNNYNVLYESFKVNLKLNNEYEKRGKNTEDELELEMKEIKMNNMELNDKENEITLNNEKTGDKENMVKDKVIYDAEINERCIMNKVSVLENTKPNICNSLSRSQQILARIINREELRRKKFIEDSIQNDYLNDLKPLVDQLFDLEKRKYIEFDKVVARLGIVKGEINLKLFCERYEEYSVRKFMSKMCIFKK